MALLQIRNLCVRFPTAGGTLQAVDEASRSISTRARSSAWSAKSGSGKSISMLAMMGLVPFPGIVTADSLTFDGQNLLGMSARQRRRLIGKDIAMIFQDPVTSLNPCFTVGFQIEETIRLHLGLDRKAARRRAIELLDQVGITAPESRLSAYPHQLSGGMSQRVMIAMAISCNPRLLIADEPTTALDVTIQAQILDLLLDLQRDRGMALILITHSMGVVAETAKRVLVMYAGQIMEEQPAAKLFAAPQHPYTEALLNALPERAMDGRLATIPGMVPGAYDRPKGCLFSPRCVYATDHSRNDQPALARLGGRARALPLSARRSAASAEHRRRYTGRHHGDRVMKAVSAHDLVQIYTIPARDVRGAGETHRRRRRVVRHRTRQDARGRRRIRFRQIHARPHGRADRTRDVRPSSKSKARTSRTRRGAIGRDFAAMCSSSSRTRTALSIRAGRSAPFSKNL